MKVKRSGYVFSLYRKNILHLWIIAGILVIAFAALLAYSWGYVFNYLFSRSEPDAETLTEFLDRDILDIGEVCAEIAANGGEEALSRETTEMFYRDNIYQEGSRYRFRISVDPSLLTDTGIYYDDEYRTYFGVESRDEIMELVPRENYPKEHLYFYDYEGRRLLLVMNCEVESSMEDTLRVTLAPMGIYSLYLIQDLEYAGYDGEICNFFIDGRETPVDYEDDDFKDLVILFIVMMIALIPAVLLTVCPVLHPIYRQLAKYARTPQKAADLVDANYEEYGILESDKKTIYLEDWVITTSVFKNGIQRNYRKQAK